jgi:hypothetical protein
MGASTEPNPPPGMFIPGGRAFYSDTHGVTTSCLQRSRAETFAWFWQLILSEEKHDLR